LDKTTEINNFISFFGDRTYIVMPKLDGLTCSITYRNGELVKAESRGDGIVGEDITHNAKVFTNLPKSIPFNDELIVDGECIITRDTFEAINANQRANGLKEYKNVRNLASGTARHFDSSIVAKRNAQFIAWKLYKADGVKFTTHFAAIKWLQELGFATVAPQPVLRNKAILLDLTCEELIEYMKKIYDDLGIPIDGMVGMFDNIKYGLSLGSTSHHPRHSLAFKFYPEENETILRDIEWSTSRTGLVNPVAIFDPIEIDGTTVSRATLNNVSIIRELQLGIGDKINVIKANEIIPQIKENLTRSDTYEIPKVCPSCGKPTVIENNNGREVLRCRNDNCPEKIHDKIANFASRDGLNIVGISEERLKALMSMGYITSFADLYHLKNHRDEIIGKPGFGENSVDNILQAIEESRKCKLSNVIVAIGIPNIGKTTAKTISEYVDQKYEFVNQLYGGELRNSLEVFLYMAAGEITHFDWSRLPGIGEKTSSDINNFVSEIAFEINALVKELDVSSDFDKSSNNLSGKTFCITGKLDKFSNRRELVADIESHGGIVVSAVTAKTNYLITNDKSSGSSKNKAAEKFGTQIISEGEYIELASL